MPPLDPEELLEQARRLAAEPTQADLRRAISAAYYGLFHFFLTAAADMIVFCKHIVRGGGLVGDQRLAGHLALRHEYFKPCIRNGSAAGVRSVIRITGRFISSTV
jgi:hypothetical protein